MPDSMADVLLIKFRISVFGVSKQWMSCSCKVSTNLVSTACDQLNFQKSYFSVAAKRTIFRFNRQGIFEFLSAYDYFVCFFIFVQITPDMIRFFYFAFCEADIVFVKCSVVEYPGQKLQTGKMVEDQDDCDISYTQKGTGGNLLIQTDSGSIRLKCR